MKTFLLTLAVCLSLCGGICAQDKPTNGQKTSQGPATDASNNPVIDPTKNVLELVEAANKRQDDLRKAAEALTSEQIKRLDDLRSAESRRVDEQATLRAEFARELGTAEANRINAIRAVDVSAVQVASERATQQASVLANQVTASADALRILVATTATTMAAQTQNLSTQLIDRIASLEKSQYENKGRSNIADPQLEKLNLLVEKLATAQTTGAAQAQGAKSVFDNSSTLILMIGGLIAIYLFVTRKRDATDTRIARR